ncbi:MAG: dephospho-CoA kinase [Sphingopyxis sp.]|nr:dephospho-CoA kinase [Sphingopyxis sp.]
MTHFPRPGSRLERPFILGLTGSIGMGKSTAAAMFRAQGVPVFDADAEVHRLQARGGALVAVIEKRFPGSTDGHGVNRAALGAIVLGNRAELAALEAIVHPAVARAQRQFLARHRARPLVVLDIPLLFEKGGWRRVGAIAVVSAPLWVQRRRVLARPGMTAAKFRAIRALQTADRVKRARADFLIDTGRPKAVMRAQIASIVSCFRR